MPKHILYIAYRQNIQQTLSDVLNFKSYRLWQNPISLAHPGMSWNESNITGFLQEPTPNSSKPISDSHSELAWTWEHRFRHWLTRDFSSTLVLLHSGGGVGLGDPPCTLDTDLTRPSPDVPSRRSSLSRPSADSPGKPHRSTERRGTHMHWIIPGHCFPLYHKIKHCEKGVAAKGRKWLECVLIW